MKQMTKHRNGTAGAQSPELHGRDRAPRVPTSSPGAPKRAEASAAIPESRLSEYKFLAPSREDIARRAYELYLSRNGRPGSPEADWLQAERELLGSIQSAAWEV